MTGGSTTLPMLVGQTSKQETLAYKVITPRNSLREMVALETAMQGLGLSKDHPVALEIAGTAAEQMWIIRGTTPDSIDHAQRQIRARYPQAEFLALPDDEDPFRLGPGETVSVIELVAGAEAVLPTRSWDEKALQKEGTDPLLGVLAAIEHLPEDLRAVAQIAMVPAPPSWAGSAGSRKAVEHPLEQEREQRRAEMYAGREKGFSWTTIIGLASILFGLYLFRLFHITLPPWVTQALSSLLHGHLPTLSGQLKVQFYGGLVALFVCLFALYVVYDQVRKRFFGKKTHIYDQRLVTQKTGQIAYRVRLRLYVISPGPHVKLRKIVPHVLWHSLVGAWHALIETWRTLRKPLNRLAARIQSRPSNTFPWEQVVITFVLILAGAIEILRGVLALLAVLAAGPNAPEGVVHWIGVALTCAPLLIGPLTLTLSVGVRARKNWGISWAPGLEVISLALHHIAWLNPQLPAAVTLTGLITSCAILLYLLADPLATLPAGLRKLWGWLAHARSTPRTLRDVLPAILRAARGAHSRIPILATWVAFAAIARQEWRAQIVTEVQWRRAQYKRREVVLLRLVAAYRQFHQGSGGYFVPRHLRAAPARRLVARDSAWWKRRCGWETGVQQSQHFASVGNLATWWHLLQAHDLSNIAMVASRSARTLLMPPDVAAASRAEIESGAARIVGYSNHAGYHLPFALYEQLLHLHALVIGKSGEGKSKFYEHVAMAAMERGGGLVVIDPHGDMIPGVLRVVPPHRESDVVLIDLADFTNPVGINPLDTTLGRRRDKTIADLLETLSHIWMRTWGSRMEIAFEFALRTAWEANRFFCNEDKQQGPDRQFTLLDILPLYTSESFCHSVLQYVEDPYVKRWWTEFYEPLNLFMQRDIINPVATKIAKFESEIARRIVGQPRSTVNLAQVIRDRKILLLRLSKGTVGADAAPLLGATILGLLSVCLEEQGILDEGDRAQFPILIDEFQVLEGVDWSMLAQLRKYGATFFLATQSLEYLQKLDPLLLPTVLANIRQIYCFNTSAQDAWTIHRELGVEPDDIINLDSHMAYVKVKAGVRRRPTFSLELDLPPVGSYEVAESIRKRSRDQYAKLPADKIDEQLQEAAVRYKRFVGPLATTTIDVDAFEPDPLPVSTPPAAQPLLPAAAPTAPQADQEARQRKRGQGGKGDRQENGSPPNQKPQGARTPEGESLSIPMLFTPWGMGNEGDQPGGDADQRGGQ